MHFVFSAKPPFLTDKILLIILPLHRKIARRPLIRRSIIYNAVACHPTGFNYSNDLLSAQPTVRHERLFGLSIELAYAYSPSKSREARIKTRASRKTNKRKPPDILYLKIKPEQLSAHSPELSILFFWKT